MAAARLLLILMSLVICNRVRAQTGTSAFSSLNDMQYGFSIKATVLIDGRRQHANPYFRIGADIGIASTFINDWLYQSLNCEFQFYNGGLGSRSRKEKICKPDFEILPSVTLTAGWANRFSQQRRDDRYVNLYYFSNFARPALQNPFLHSLSIGGVFSKVFDHAKRSQRIGFLDFNFGGGFQVSYYNDGSVPFKQIYLGDGYDRYHTGGGMISYNGPRGSVLPTVELAYHKYTGFTKNTFEVSNLMKLAYMAYQDPEQQYFNRSQFDLTLANPFKGYGLQVQQYNDIGLDLQHDIHTAVMDTYHLVPYEAYWTFGATYFGHNQHTGYK